MRKILLSLLVLFAFTSVKADIMQDSCCFDIDTLVITGDTIACYGDSVELCVPYDSCLTYLWYHNSNPIYPSNSNCIYATQTGTYTVTATNACDVASSAGFYVYIGASQLDVSISCLDQRTGCKLTANPTGGTTPYTYLWSNFSTSQTIISLSETTSYVVTVTDSIGCTAIAYGSCALCGGSKSRSTDIQIENEEIDIYPNPSSGQVSIELPVELFNSEVEILVMDLTGKTAFRSIHNEQTRVSLDLSHLNSGIYIVELVAGDWTCKKRIILEKSKSSN